MAHILAGFISSYHKGNIPKVTRCVEELMKKAAVVTLIV